MISLLTHGLFRNVLLCFTTHWFNQGLSFWKMIRTFCRLVSFWIMLFQGVLAASLRCSTWPSPLAGPCIPFFFFVTQPHRFLETAQLFRYCLGIDKSQGKKWLRLLSQLMHSFWDLDPLVCNALVIFWWLEADWKKKKCLVHVFQYFLQEGSLWWASLPLSPRKMSWRQDLGVGPHVPRPGAKAASWQLEELGYKCGVQRQC